MSLDALPAPFDHHAFAARCEADAAAMDAHAAAEEAGACITSHPYRVVTEDGQLSAHRAGEGFRLYPTAGPGDGAAMFTPRDAQVLVSAFHRHGIVVHAVTPAGAYRRCALSLRRVAAMCREAAD